MKPKNKKNLLVFNCHEPWVYQLGYMDCNLDIIVGLKGIRHSGWDEHMRPVPPNSRLIQLDEAIKTNKKYDCIIAHNITDLLDVKSRNEPKLIMLHSTLEGRVREEKGETKPTKIRKMLQQYLSTIGGHAVATSMFKGESWGFIEDIVCFGIEANEYYAHTGEHNCGLRICNFIESRRKILMWDLHEQAFSGLPVKLVGHNPTLPDVTASTSWDQLKEFLRHHRFYIHTADPRYEAGFNMASAEAMAAGLPVLGNKHPTSPIKHGVSGFLSDEPEVLRKYAKILLEDSKLAFMMGQQARKTAIKQFSISRFKQAIWRSIEKTCRKFQDKERRYNLSLTHRQQLQNKHNHRECLATG